MTTSHSLLKLAGSSVLAGGMLAAVVGVNVQTVRAEPSVFPTFVRTCTALNCGSQPVRGVISGFVLANEGNPWNGQFILASGSCARFDVATQSADLEMTVVSPDGRMFTNDDFGNLTPRVVIASPSSGVHTVVLNHFLGDSVNADFFMQVSQYNSGNPNCASPTLAPLTPSAAKSGGSSNAPAAGAPGSAD
jgi:hypothetical protein